MRDAQLLALIGPDCRWERVPHRDAYDCRYCGSRVTGILIVALRQSLKRR